MSRNPAVTLPLVVVSIGAILKLAIEFGAPITETQTERILDVAWAVGILAAWLVVGVLVSRQTMPTVDVTEYVDSHGQVRAGAANELPDGTHVRPLGSSTLHEPVVISEPPRYADTYIEDDEPEPEPVLPVVVVNEPTNPTTT